MSIDREAWLQVCAYHIWQSEGCPDGRDRAHWTAAERVFADVAPAPEAAASTAKGRTRTVKAAPTAAAAKAAKPAARRKKPAAQAAAPSL